MKGLNPRHALFVAAYRKTFNATEAAIAAGYGKAGAKSRGSELLQLPEIQAALRAAEEKIAAKALVTEEQIILELLAVAFNDIGDAFDADGKLLPLQRLRELTADEVDLQDAKRMPEKIRRAIASVEVDELFEGSGEDRAQVGFTRKVKFVDKLRALELLGKHLGMFVEKHELVAGVTLEQLMPKSKFAK